MSRTVLSREHRRFNIVCAHCHTKTSVNRLEYDRILVGISKSGWSWKDKILCPTCTPRSKRNWRTAN